MRVIYADSLFIMNLAADGLLLLAAGRICALRTRLTRILLGAVLGALFSVLSVFPGFSFLSSPWLIVPVGLLMVLCAYGEQKRLPRVCAVFFLSSATFAGVTWALLYTIGSDSLPARAVPFVLAATYVVTTGVFRFSQSRDGKGGTAELTIELDGKSVKLRALRDTGNSLRDPLTGGILPVVEADAVKELFRNEIARIICDEKMTAPDKLSEIWNRQSSVRMRLVSYRAIGVDGGLLPAFRADKVTVAGSQQKGRWIAISPTSLISGSDCSAIVNGDA